MTETTGGLPPSRTEMVIGGKTYIVTDRFNGDKKHNIIESVARLIERGEFAPQG